MRRKTMIFILIFLILTVGIILRIQNLVNLRNRSPDERIYTYQAKTIVQQGSEGIKLLVREYNKDERMWLYPPPIRVGYLWLLAAVMKVTNLMDVKAGVYISCFFSILSLLLLIVLGLRFFNQWITLYALLFMSVSPMSLAVARRTWQEAMLGCIGLLLIYFCCEITCAPHKIMWYAPFVAVGSYCILIKSSGIAIYALCIAWLLWVLFIKEKSFLKGFLLIASSALGVGISIAFLLHAIGGVSNLKEVLTNFKGAIQTNAYASEYCSGPWYQFFGLLWMLSPVSTALYFVGSIGAFLFHNIYQKTAALAIIKNRNIILAIVSYVIAFMVVLFLCKEYFLNLRYVSVLYVPFYLISGLGLWYIIIFARKILKNFSFSIVIAGIVAVIIVTAVNDYRNFKTVIVKPGILDLSIGLLRESSR